MIINMEKTKKCSKCEIVKDIQSSFHKDSSTKDGYTAQCKLCRHESSKRYYKTERGKEQHRVYESIRRECNHRKMIFDLAKQRAKKKNIEFTITLDDIIIPDVCPVFGIKFDLSNNKLSNNSPTLDRVNNKIGYTKENIRVISWRANRLKSDGTIIEIEKIIAYMYENLPEFRTKTGTRRQQRPSKYYTYNGKAQGLTDWAEEYNLPYGVLNTRVNRDGWDFERAILTPVKTKSKRK